MKKKTILLLFCVLTYSKVFLQTLDTAGIQVYYSFYHLRDTLAPDKFYTEHLLLLLGKTNSVYKTADQALADSAKKALFDKAQKDMASGVPVTIDMRGVKRATETKIFKSSVEKKITFIEVFNKVNYLIEANMPVLNWTVVDESKQIQGYTCQKATTNFRGRSYEAWFCSAIPYSEGPWKFSGLPGLILEVYDTKRQVNFTLTKIDTTINELVALPERFSRTTDKEFKQMVQAARENLGAFLNGQAPSMEGDIKFTTKTTPAARNFFNNPIELSKD